jgi:hypothetical protein
MIWKIPETNSAALGIDRGDDRIGSSVYTIAVTTLIVTFPTSHHPATRGQNQLQSTAGTLSRNVKHTKIHARNGSCALKVKVNPNVMKSSHGTTSSVPARLTTIRLLRPGVNRLINPI